jgi:subtilisin-like proprotein convertase family protein
LFRVVPKNDISTKNISLEITGPNGVPAVLKTDDNGVVSIQSGADSAGMIGKTPLGNWKIKVIDGESITEGGVLKYDNIYNIQMGLEYSLRVSEEVTDMREIRY